MAREDLLINLEVETGELKKDLAGVEESLKDNDRQSKQLDKELRQLEKTFLTLSREVRSVDKQLTTSQKTLAVTAKSFDEVAKGTTALVVAYRSIEGAVKGVSNAFAVLRDQLVAAQSFFEILNNLTDPDFIIRLSRLTLLLATAARIKGFSGLSAQLNELSDSLGQAAVFFAKFRKDGELSLATLTERAILLRDIQESVQFTATAAGALTLIGVITGLNDVLLEFGVVTKSISRPLANMPVLIQTTVGPLRVFVENVKELSKTTLKVADSFTAFLSGGRTFSEFIRDLPGLSDQLDKATEILVSAFDNVMESFEELVLVIQKRASSIRAGLNVIVDAVIATRKAYLQEFQRMVLMTEEPFARFELVVQTRGQRISRAVDALLGTSLVAPFRNGIEAIIGGMPRLAFGSVEVIKRAVDRAATALVNFDVTSEVMVSAVRGIGQSFLDSSPLLQRLTFNVMQFAAVATPLFEEVGAAVLDVFNVFKKMGSFAPTFFDDIAFGFKAAFSSKSFAEFGLVFTTSIKSAFALATGVASIGFEELVDIAKNRGSTIVGIMAHTGRLLASSFAVGVDSALLSIAEMEFTTVGALRGIGEGITRAARTFAEGFKIGFTAPLAAAGHASKTFGSVVAASAPSLLTLTEAGNVAGPAVLAVGSAAVRSENNVVKFGGAVAIVAGVALAGLTTAMLFFLDVVGRFLESVGDKLISAMTMFEEKFQKAELVTKSFTFAIVNFGKILGEESVGSLSKWNTVVDEITANSQFSVSEIRKATQLMVSEGQALGLTVDQNEALLRRATDLAAAKGLEVADTLDRLMAGITGISTAVRALGINVGEHTLEHSKFAESLSEEGVELTEATKLLIRYNEVMAQSAPLAGFAKEALNTVAGAQNSLNKTLERAQIILGQQTTFTMTYLTAITSLAELFLDLPESLLVFTGVLVDVSGVTAKVMGVTLQYTLVLSSLATLYSVLNKVILTSTFVQANLSKAILFAAAAVNVKTVAVVGLTSVLRNMLIILTGALIKALKSLGVVILSLAKQFAIFTFSVLTNPLFIKASLIVGGILLLVKAYAELRAELKQLQPVIEDTSEEMKAQATLWETIKASAVGTIRFLIDGAKLVVIGLIKIVKMLEVAVVGWKLLAAVVTKNEQRAGELGVQFANLLDNLGELDDAAAKATISMLSVFEDTAVAADGTVKSVEKVSAKVRGFSDALKDVQFDPEQLKIQVLGDEFDKALVAIDEARLALNRARDIGIEKDGKFEKATAKEISDLARTLEERRLELIKMRRDALKEVGDMEKDLNIKALEGAGKEIEAIKLRGAAELKQFNERVNGLAKIAALSANELRSVERVRQAIQEATNAEVARAEAEQAEKRKKDLEKIRDEYEKHLKTIQDLAGELRKIQREGLESSEQVAALAKLDLDTRLEELSLLERRLLLQERFSEKGLDGTYRLKAEYQSVLDLARKIAQQKFEEARPFTVGDLVDTMKSAFDKAKTFAGDLFSGALSVGDLFKNIKLPSLAEMGDSIKKAVLDIDLKKVGAALADGIVAGAELIGKLFDPAVINGLADSVTNMAKLPNELGKAFNNLVGSLDRFLANFPAAVEKILQALPGLIQRVLDRLPEFISKLADAFVMLLDKLPALVGRILDAVPGLIARIMSELPRIVLAAFQSLGLIIGQVIRTIPDAFLEILEHADEFVAAFVEGLIASMGDIVVAFVDFLIGGGLEKIVAALLRAVPKIAGALVSGFLKGIQRAMGSIFGGISIPEELTELPNRFSEGVKNLAAKTTEEASKLFKVLDLEAAARGLDRANQIEDVLNRGILAFEIKFRGLIDWLLEAWRKIVGWLKEIFEWVLTGIQKVFQWVVDNVLMPLATAIQKAFQWVIDNVLLPLAGIVTAAFKWVVDNVVLPLAEGIKAAWKWVKESVIDPVVDALKKVFGFLKDDVFKPYLDGYKKLFDGLKATFEAFTNVIKTIFDAKNFKDIGGKIWEGLKKGLDTVGTVIQNALNIINPANLFSKMFQMDYQGQGLVERTLGIDIPFANFAKGGMVPGQAVVGGDSLLNDRVLAMLSPGEAVIPRSKMDDPRVNSIVNAILRGELLPSNYAKGGLVGTLQSIGGGLLSTLSGAVSGALGAAAGPIVRALSPESFGRLATAIEGGFDPRTAKIGELGAIVGSFGDARKVMDALGTTVSGIGKGALDSITSTVELAKKGADNALQAMEQLKYLLSPEDMWALVKEKVFGSIIKMFEANRFHSGGLVPGFAFGGEVPAMLQPGEFVLNKGAVQNLGLGTLSNLNRGMMTGNQEFNFDIKLEVNADGVPDESFIRQRLVPTLKKELKEASLRGEFVISNKGIRST